MGVSPPRRSVMARPGAALDTDRPIFDPLSNQKVSDFRCVEVQDAIEQGNTLIQPPKGHDRDATNQRIDAIDEKSDVSGRVENRL